ncbi:MAG TPA: hypothetical protein VL403_01445 [Candidatus Kryptonia bacterium]|nr:hypothetical protein [Candidatus Kryptonia bacterium]
MVVMVAVMAMMLRQEILAGLRQLVAVLVYALEDGARAGGVSAVRLHVRPACLLPSGDVGLHPVQVLLAGWG